MITGLADGSMCWAAAKTDTLFTIFDSSVFNKQLLIFRTARTEDFAADQKKLYERDLFLWLE